MIQILKKNAREALSLLKCIHVELLSLPENKIVEYGELIKEIISLTAELLLHNLEVLAKYNRLCPPVDRLTTSGNRVGAARKKEIIIYNASAFAEHIREAMTLGYINCYIKGWCGLLASIQTSAGSFVRADCFQVYMAKASDESVIRNTKKA